MRAAAGEPQFGHPGSIVRILLILLLFILNLRDISLKNFSIFFLFIYPCVQFCKFNLIIYITCMCYKSNQMEQQKNYIDDKN